MKSCSQCGLEYEPVTKDEHNGIHAGSHDVAVVDELRVGDADGRWCFTHDRPAKECEV